MMSVAYKEGIKVTPQVMQELIIASNNDIRQVSETTVYVYMNYEFNMI